MMPLTDLLKNKLQLSKHYNISIKDVGELPFWEFEETIKLVNQMAEEEDKYRKSQEDSQKAEMPNFNPSSMMNNIGKNMPKF